MDKKTILFSGCHVYECINKVYKYGYNNIECDNIDGYRLAVRMTHCGDSVKILSYSRLLNNLIFENLILKWYNGESLYKTKLNEIMI